MTTSKKMISLDYIFGEGENLDAYQLVRFVEGEPWLVLDDGLLLATIIRQGGKWMEIGKITLLEETRMAIGRFIDSQHFNLLPDKIKSHWFDSVEEVIMQNDSYYLVICKSDIDFIRFKNVFASFISDLVEDEWSVEFKVYNAEFTEEFLVRVF